MFKTKFTKPEYSLTAYSPGTDKFRVVVHGVPYWESWFDLAKKLDGRDIKELVNQKWNFREEY